MAPAAKRRKTSAVKAKEPTQPDDSTATTKKVEEPQYPGFDPWHATLEIAGGDDKMSKFDNDKAEFVHSAKVYDTDAFRLKPLTISDGPLKGRHVLMLEPIKDHFRFMDLPAEIRLIIYDMLFKETDPVCLEIFKSKLITHQRAVRSGFQSSWRHQGLIWDAKRSKWPGQTPSAHSVLRVSKTINAEAAPIAYGSNSFAFAGLSELKAFLEGIGTMRRFLRHVTFDYHDYARTIASPAFHKLKDAHDLKSLTFRHATICAEREKWRWDKTITVQKLASDLKPLLKVLHKAQKSSDNPINVLDIIKVAIDRYLDICPAGQDGEECSCAKRWQCTTKCRDWKGHVGELQLQLRKAIAKELGIEEPSQ